MSLWSPCQTQLRAGLPNHPDLVGVLSLEHVDRATCVEVTLSVGSPGRRPGLGHPRGARAVRARTGKALHGRARSRSHDWIDGRNPPCTLSGRENEHRVVIPALEGIDRLQTA